MNLKEAKALYKGCIVKEVGYHPDEETQFIYKSEASGEKKIICLIDGIPYILPDGTHAALKTYLETKTGLPSTITYNRIEERFKVPFNYLVNYSSQIVKTPELKPEPVITIPVVTLSDVPTISSVAVTDEVGEVLLECRSRIDSLSDDKLNQYVVKLTGVKSIVELYESNVNINLEKFVEESDKESLINVITNLILIYKNK